MNNHTVNISELSDKFNVTNQTIRRDLNQLESEGFINRTYGGAVLNEAKVDFAVPFYRRLSKNKDGKDKIALQVIPLLVNCNSILLIQVLLLLMQ
ncbi:DeoR family transcriptional regulator [Lactobacillus sp. R2/2]|nr:DeoR family transcriptional regulator [Lactobacillus sp. R2/2]